MDSLAKIRSANIMSCCISQEFANFKTVNASHTDVGEGFEVE
jgi:hypothetical protein